MSTQQISGFIDDGYTESASIAAEPGLWQEMRFTFRPMLADEYAAFSDFCGRNTDVKAKQEIARRLAEKVKDWDLVDSAGKPVPVTQQNLLRIKPVLLAKLWNIVCGLQAGDGPGEESPNTGADLGN